MKEYIEDGETVREYSFEESDSTCPVVICFQFLIFDILI